MRVIRFTLPEPTPLLNVMQRKHFRSRAREKTALARQIIAILGQDRPETPIEHASVTIRRYSSGMPDFDGVYGGAKDFLDVLTTPAAQANGKIKNKYGVGLIRDDSPKHIRLTVEPIKCKRAEARTEVVVEEMMA